LLRRFVFFVVVSSSFFFTIESTTGFVCGGGGGGWWCPGSDSSEGALHVNMATETQYQTHPNFRLGPSSGFLSASSLLPMFELYNQLPV
jgi:hypothetical protein